MWIEFLGGVGSGKSSLATALKKRSKVAGIPVTSAEEALEIRLAQSLPKTILEGPAGHATRRALLAGWQMRFSWEHPSLVWHAWSASQKLRNLPSWHRKIILSLFFEVAGWYEGVSTIIPPKRMVIVDEGLAHRSINLFAWQTDDLNKKRIRGYVKNLPQVPLTILVCAPMEVCLERAYNRGLPARLRGKDPQTIRDFIEKSHTVASLVGKIMIANGRSVITIDNSAGLEQSIGNLYRQINETALFQEYFVRPYQTPFSQTAKNQML